MRSSVGLGRFSRLRAWWTSLERGQRRTLVMMAAVVVGLHVAGFVTLFALVAPAPLPPRQRRARSRSGSA